MSGIPMLIGPKFVAKDEVEPVATDLHLVAVVQGRLIGALPIHVGAVERTDIPQHVSALGPVEHDVATRHRDVVEEDLRVGMTTDVGVLGLEPERRAGIRAVAHDQQPYSRRQTLEIIGELVFGVGGLDGVQRLGVLVNLCEGRAA